MVDEWQARAAYAGHRAGIEATPAINNALQKTLESTNRDTALWIRELRRRMHLTQNAMAKAVGCSPYLISQGEAGTYRPNSDHVRGLLIAVGQRYQMPPLPPARQSYRGPAGPFFPDGLEAAFQREFYGGNVPARNEV